CTRATTTLQEPLGTEAAATHCWPGARPTWGRDPECTFGSEWTGMLPIRQAQCSCLSAVTSAWELRSSFGCIFRKEKRCTQRESRCWHCSVPWSLCQQPKRKSSISKCAQKA